MKAWPPARHGLAGPRLLPGRGRSHAAGRLEAGLGWPALLAQALPSRMAGAACTIVKFGRGRPYMAWPRAAGARMMPWRGPGRSDTADGLTAGRGRFKPCRGRPAPAPALRMPPLALAH
jgi:hypothetical protein